MCHSASSAAAIPIRVQEYVQAIVWNCADDGRGLASIVLFGSAAVGGWADAISDVDLILVVPDGATDEGPGWIRGEVRRIERLHGFCGHSADEPFLERFLNRVTARDRTFFVCTRSDLLSGDIGRILGVSRSQAMFVDRIVLANFVASGITAWGEALLPLVPVPPIRRFDVFKALFGLFPLTLLSAALFPLHPGMTKYAMAMLKSSVHSCFFCYERRRASLEEEAGFFERRFGPSRTLTQLLELRRAYRHSFAFAVRCIPTILRLHWRTFIDVHFEQ